MYLEGGLPQDIIAEELGIGKSTLSKWVKVYREEGDAGLKGSPRKCKSVYQKQSVMKLLPLKSRIHHLVLSESLKCFGSDFYLSVVK